MDLPCSRNARSKTPLAGLMARLGVPVGGWVRKWRAVEEPSAPIRETSKLGGGTIWILLTLRRVCSHSQTPNKQNKPDQPNKRFVLYFIRARRSSNA